ncbi:multiple inositol polyphosphate phosphatase 1b isoform X1 [Sebastes umbrosus]|uniref:multiple inositol polyphosphate phosphatase 1b isoform X1 n=1 Tax=Sebastes umbrosus TaxID=72105 RepID=UPI0018A0D9CA|nr:multiple inositol polyphosphate phosphatase 1b isoform X1 [Sebastes umbrosus]XP_037610375.1 multiple inositol polyphosphate phosphatase 1b isoform X1 [Sebastes umbrosus]XP_037610377.1 multiple inositol polyphosphate phosphatase 1b isoform X1 [Sebastes umbrosus]
MFMKVLSLRDSFRLTVREVKGHRNPEQQQQPVTVNGFMMFSGSPSRTGTGLLVLALTRLVSSLSVPLIAGYFGTKTRYQEVNPVLLLDGLTVNRTVLRPPGSESCEPVHLTAVIRHGARYPTHQNILKIRTLSELVRREETGTGTGTGTTGSSSSRTSSWLQDIQNRWEMWYTDDMDGQLVMKGREDLRQLARRLSVLFPSLLSEDNRRRISLRSSSKHRCVSSVEAFQDGLQQHWRRTGEAGQVGRSDVQYSHQVDDELMRFFEHCRGYVEGVEKNRTALLEVEKFQHGEEMEAVRKRMAEKLGLHQQQLTPDLVEAAFFLCSYELSIKSLNSPWCFLFDEDDAKVLEYKSDLKQYWKRSHGHSISSLSSCPLFHHIFRTLDKAGRPRRSTDASPEPASILVGHAETLLPLLSLLGLYKDQTPPTADNYHTQHGRSFRSSLIVPYAANLLFVLYDCQRGPRLQLLVNESPVRFPGLTEDTPLYRDVRATYRHLLDGCDFHRECEGRTGGRGPNTEL